MLQQLPSSCPVVCLSAQLPTWVACNSQRTRGDGGPEEAGSGSSNMPCYVACRLAQQELPVVMILPQPVPAGDAAGSAGAEQLQLQLEGVLRDSSSSMNGAGDAAGLSAAQKTRWWKVGGHWSVGA
jgi:hypothetical protein